MKCREAIVAALEQSYEWNRMLAEDLRDAPLAFPTSNGGNHAVWVVGHAALSRATLLTWMTGQPNPLESWDAVLGGDSQPVADASVYPAYEELMDTWEREHNRMLDTLANLSDEDLDDEPAALPTQHRDVKEFRTVGRLFVFAALHEMSHRGQLADVRRALGRGKLAF